MKDSNSFQTFLNLLVVVAVVAVVAYLVIDLTGLYNSCANLSCASATSSKIWTVVGQLVN